MKPGAWQRLRKRGDMSVAVGLFSIALLALVWSTVIFEARSERAAVITAAVTQSSNLAVAYEEHVIRTLKGLDAITLFIRHEYAQHGRGLDLPAFGADGVIDPNLFSILSIVDAHGDVVASSNPAAVDRAAANPPAATNPRPALRRSTGGMRPIRSHSRGTREYLS